jgi:predicted aminopeptidase
MTLYEIANPSDAYTIEGELLPCAIATLLVGEGAYGLKTVDGETAAPIFLFGGHEEWLKERGVDDMPTYLENPEHRAEVAAALETVLIGDFADRKRMERVLACVTSDDERTKAKAAWHDERRSSMNDIGRRAALYAKRLRSPA